MKLSFSQDFLKSQREIFLTETIQINMTNTIYYFGSAHFLTFFGVKVVTFEKDASPKPNGFTKL